MLTKAAKLAEYGGLKLIGTVTALFGGIDDGML
jgi:hypothetical protein